MKKQAASHAGANRGAFNFGPSLHSERNVPLRLSLAELRIIQERQERERQRVWRLQRVAGWEESGLMAAVKSGDGDTIRKLAGERAWSDRGCKALHLAADLGSSNVVRALLDSGAHKNARNKRGDTPLHRAALAGSFEVLSLLLEEGADKNVVNRDGDTPLHRTMCGGHLDVAQMLLGGSASDGHLKTATLLIEAGVDLNARNKLGSTPLHIAAEEGLTEIARLLLRSGADKELRDVRGATPLALSAWREKKELSQLLADAGADSGSPLMWAVGHRDLPTVQRLLALSAGNAPSACRAKDCDGNTPLQVAVRHSDIKIARVLLQASADPNLSLTQALAERGLTLLHWAALTGDCEMAQLLVDAGAYLSVRDSRGRTPEAVARRLSKRDVAEYLQQAAAERRTAVAMGQHARLGATSWLRALDAEVVGIILAHT